MTTEFTHIQTAHCENGVTVNLLRLAGHEYMTEPLAFGIGAGLFYFHLPFFTFSNGPAVSFRTMPGKIFKRTCNSLNIEVASKKFRNQLKAQDYIDMLLAKGHTVGCQVGVYHLPYFPVEYRFHFNAHNLLVYGKDGTTYMVSDPVMDKVTTLQEEELNRVRFAQGMLAPKGHLYYITQSKPTDTKTIQKAIAQGIRINTRDMLHIPGTFGGVSGILYTAKKITTWRDQLGIRKAGQYLAQIIRMQEEIGTGGGGFRFMYAAFLQQAYAYIPDERLLKISDEFTKSGDLWRANAIHMAGVLRGRTTEQKDFETIANIMKEIYVIEKQACKDLQTLKLHARYD